MSDTEQVIEQIAEMTGTDIHDVANAYKKNQEDATASGKSTRDIWLSRMESIRTPETTQIVDYLIERLDAGDVQAVLSAMHVAIGLYNKTLAAASSSVHSFDTSEHTPQRSNVHKRNNRRRCK